MTGSYTSENMEENAPEMNAFLEAWERQYEADDRKDKIIVFMIFLGFIAYVIAAALTVGYRVGNMG